MRIISLLWGFSLGGIGKVAITYGELGDYSELEILTVCIQLENVDVDMSALDAIDHRVIYIKNRFDLSWLIKLGGIIKEFGPNKLFVHGFNGPVIGFIVQKLFNFDITIICSYHGLYHAPTTLKKIVEPLFNYLPRIVYKYSSSRVITVENYSKKFLISKNIPKEKISVVYNGITALSEVKELSIRGFCIEDGIFKLGIASRIDPVKGIIYLIEALPILKTLTNHAFQLIIVGEGSSVPSLKNRIKELNLEDVVSFVGYQNNIPAWLNVFDLFVLPSLAEYHSIGLLEAMRAGKPIVATNVGGNPESIRHGIDGFLVPPGNSKALAISIAEMINNPTIRTELANSALKRFENHFTEDVMTENLIKVLMKAE